MVEKEKTLADFITVDEAQILKAGLEQLNIKADPSAMRLLLSVHDKLDPLIPKVEEVKGNRATRRAGK
jgi:hypothetical protein